ncbi:hypothetical protein WICMUC_000377 [Wickerhamomyces mucosus]|uniref:VWFA domain-containing protein n=1 Tax=Wickerhamomyces mucosus TaxID=1378264 RepID=A0A9P8PZC4_9ASCO|nr:hypothetical protein WICMUC_000377 [Wickerhamomyces mucosus]
MVLESTIIILDNSEYTRNGDYSPNRYSSQLDSIDLIFHSKINSNPETTVGLLSGAGSNVSILSTLTNDYGKLLKGLNEIKISGDFNLINSIQVAILALKHRQNKNSNSRIISFVASPIEENDKELIKLGKKLKKNNIALDLINFGEESLNTIKLENLLQAVNSNENSHLITIPPGFQSLYESIATSSIIHGNTNDGGNIGGNNDNDFGAFNDADMDPDLALALRLSLEEEQARQLRVNQNESNEPLDRVEES